MCVPMCKACSLVRFQATHHQTEFGLEVHQLHRGEVLVLNCSSIAAGSDEIDAGAKLVVEAAKEGEEAVLKVRV